MDKRYFYIGLLSLLFAANILAMTEEEFGEDLWLEPSVQAKDDIPIGHGFGGELGQHLPKRTASAAIPSAKKARKASSRGDIIDGMIACGNNCNSKFKRSSNNLYTDIMVHLLFSQEHNLDNYNSVCAMVEENVKFNSKKRKLTVSCLKDLCKKKISADSKSKESLILALLRHWCSKKHNPENFAKIKNYIRRVDSGENNGESFYDALFHDLVAVRRDGENVNQEVFTVLTDEPEMVCLEELLLKSRPSSDTCSLACIYYPHCTVPIQSTNKDNLFYNLIRHMCARSHNPTLYNKYSSVKGKSILCPEGCGKNIFSKDKDQFCRQIVFHLHSKKHNPKGYHLLRAYVSKIFPDMFLDQIPNEYCDKNVLEIRQEYIRLFSGKKE